MTAELPPAGWYPNPTGQPGQMYWDGQQWQTTLPPSEPVTTAVTATQQPETHLSAQPAGLSNPVALGAVSPNAISSIAYGPEQILLELLPMAGLAAFALLLPITIVVVVILVFVAASYGQVVKVYARAGGAYLVARDNFGPRGAQVAAAALLIDYVATVALQCAAGTVAVASAVPALGPHHLEIAIGVVLALCSINVLGWRRPGPVSAIITYLFVALIALTIVTGSVREILWGLPVYDPLHIVGAVPVHQGSGLVMGATVLVVLRAFANGGSSLTGVESVADAADVFREPKGLNAGRVLTVIAVILGFLLLGVAWLAHATHATPYIDEYPSMLSQVVRVVFGGGSLGNMLYLSVMAATAAILLAGANTGIHRFSALASFVVKNQALPQPPTNRVDRGVLAGGIVLAALSIILLLLTGGSVNALVLIYAIPVFTAFSLSGYAMTKHHGTHREPGWLRHLAVSLAAAILSSIVVAIFVVTKFTEGAWFVIFEFLVLLPVLILRNRGSAAPMERTRR